MDTRRTTPRRKLWNTTRSNSAARSTDLHGQTRRRGGASSREPARVALDVPHILRKLKMRRYEASDSELNLRAFLRCKFCCKIASDWFNIGQKKKSRCQRPVVETFAGVALSCCGAGDGASRPVLLPFPQRSPHPPGSHHRVHHLQLRAL